MNLYLVHCGFYEAGLSSGIYELHVNYLVAAPSFAEAKAKVKTFPEFQAKNMHVDGMEEVKAVQGYRVHLQEDAQLCGESEMRTMSYKDLEAKNYPPA